MRPWAKPLPCKYESASTNGSSMSCVSSALKSALRQKFAEIFLRLFHHDIQQIESCELAASRFVDFDQIWVRELRRLLPSRKLRIGIRGVCLNELDRGLFVFVFAAERSKHDAMVGGGLELHERKLPVDYLAFGVAPAVRHACIPQVFRCLTNIIRLQVPAQVGTWSTVGIW